MTKAQALDYINNYDPTIEGRKFMGASYYKPSPGPSPRPAHRVVDRQVVVAQALDQ